MKNETHSHRASVTLLPAFLTGGVRISVEGDEVWAWSFAVLFWIVLFNVVLLGGAIIAALLGARS